MATVFLSTLLRPLADGATSVQASGSTLRSIIDDLDRRYPGLGERVVEAGAIRPDVLIAIGSNEVRDLDAAVPEGDDVHILPAIAGA